MLRVCILFINLQLSDQTISHGETAVWTIDPRSRFRERCIDVLLRLDRYRPREHSGFGAGPHLCPGTFLARMEARAALDALLARIDELTLGPGYRFDTNPVPWALGLQSLPVHVALAAP